jgi:predicted chitinase
MYRRLLITESEKNQIKDLYGLSEQNSDNSIFSNIVKTLTDRIKQDRENKVGDGDLGIDVVDSKPEISVSGTGGIEIKGNFNSEQSENIKIIIDEMTKMGITDPITQIGILSVIAKESNFKTFKEVGYGNTSDSRIVSIFGGRGRRCKHLKSSNPEFFDCVYGYKSGAKLGNDQPGDGWKYVGRGFNGLTGKANYKKYGSMVGVDLVGNPNLMEDPRVASKVAIAFFTKGKPINSFPKFKDKKEAAIYFADINAGGRGSEFGRGPAIAASGNFDIKTSNVA